MDTQTRPLHRRHLALSAMALPALALLGGRRALAQPALLLRERFETLGRQPAEMLGGVLSIGQAGPWQCSLEQGGYVMANASQAGNLRTYYLGQVNGTTPGAVEAEVLVNATTEQAGAGVLAAHDAQSNSYVLVLAGAGGNYTVISCINGQASIAMSGTHGAIRRNAVNTVRALRGADGVALSINGARLGSIGNPALTGRGVGIGAFGLGQFRFNEVRIFAG